MVYHLLNLLNLVQVFLGTTNEEFKWKTEFNDLRDYSKPWVYEKDGELHFSRGQQGHFIYQQLIEVVKEHIGNWVFEYAMSNLEGGK